MTENVADPVASTTKQLRDFVADGLVTYSHEGVARAQMKIYYDCLVKHAHKHDWMAFFDVDEYLVLMERSAPPPPTHTIPHHHLTTRPPEK